MGEDGHDEDVDDERDEQRHGRFDEDVHVGPAHGRLVFAVHLARLPIPIRRRKTVSSKIFFL